MADGKAAGVGDGRWTKQKVGERMSMGRLRGGRVRDVASPAGKVPLCGRIPSDAVA